MTPAVSTRPMCPADLDAVLAIADSLKDAPRWTRLAYTEALAAETEPRRIALVAEAVRGEVAGFAVARLVAPEAELETIAVAAASQRQGVGRLLLEALAGELRQAGAQEMLLEVRASNRAAQALYRALGFGENGRRPRYYAEPVEDAVLMALPLR